MPGADAHHACADPAVFSRRVSQPAGISAMQLFLRFFPPQSACFEIDGDGKLILNTPTAPLLVNHLFANAVLCLRHKDVPVKLRVVVEPVAKSTQLYVAYRE